MTEIFNLYNLKFFKLVENNYNYTSSSSSSFVFRVFSPSRGLHANMFSFQHFPPQEPVHWVNTNHIPVFFVMQDCICPVFLRPSTTATTLNNQVRYMSNASFISLYMPLPSQSVVSNCRFDISDASFFQQRSWADTVFQSHVTYPPYHCAVIALKFVHVFDCRCPTFTCIQ